MLGLPSLKRDSDIEYKQGLEKIIFPMMNQKFNILIIAQSFTQEQNDEILKNCLELSQGVHTLVKEQINFTESEGSSEAQTESKSKIETISKTKSISATLKAGNVFIEASATASASQTDTYTNSETMSETFTKSLTTSKGSSKEQINRIAQYCEELIENYIKRFQQGKAKGLFNTAFYIQADDESTLAKLSHTLKAVYAGEQSFYEELRFSPSFELETPVFLTLKRELEHPIHPSFAGLSSALNTDELAILCALPRKDITGLRLRKRADFALNNAKHCPNDELKLGKMLFFGEKTAQDFSISLDELNHHLFVCGITGAGKSNTIRQILSKISQKNIPFLVIEPAKSEYFKLKSEITNLQIFCPGDEAFKFNPFVFENENELGEHLDMLKATFNASFPMEGPMSYVLETALHKVYEKKGWNFEKEKHKLFTQSYEADSQRKTLLFPTMNDLIQIIDEVVASLKYAPEIDANLKAALKTRLKNLTLGKKARIYNSRYCLSNEILFENPTIIELSHIADDCEKAFLMGLILNKLYFYRQSKGDAKNELKHLCIIEEAHRLLPNVSLQAQSGGANPQGAAVQSFVNILAEIRSLGEGIIIADQIPSKLHKDTIKNTGTKILHRTMDKEDRDIMGDCINLNDEQKLDLAKLAAGEAVFYSKSLEQAILISVDELKLQEFSKEKENEFKQEFIEKFFENQGEIYKYEFINEKDYYPTKDNPESKETICSNIKEIPAFKRAKTLLECFNAILLDKNQEQIKSCFKEFFALYEKESKSDINFHSGSYLFTLSFKQLNFLGSFSSYKSIDVYSFIHKFFCELIENICKNEDLSEKIKELQKEFAHKNLVLNLSAMSDYPKERLDYTLLILENLRLKPELRKELSLLENKENLQIKDYEKILKTSLGLCSKDLLECLKALRLGY